MSATSTNLAPDRGSPAFDNTGDGTIDYLKREIKLLHDPNMSLEEYMFYAALSRRKEQKLHGANKGWNNIGWCPGYGQEADISKSLANMQRARSGGISESASQDEKEKERHVKISSGVGNAPALDQSDTSVAEGQYLGVADSEWETASRAARTASWGTVFYLITTDIIGPQSVPWALSQMGWGPGIALYFVFGVLAFYAGMQIWQLFMVLDSDRYPLKTYGDIAYRTMGKYARHGVNILQSVQLFFNVGIIILSDGQAIYQISEGPHAKKGLCFIVCNLLFTVAGCLLGQIRTLRRFGVGRYLCQISN